LPQGRKIVLDAKAPLDDYIAACAAEDSGFGIQDSGGRGKQELLERSARALRRQIDLLSSKKYWEDCGGPDFVIMFVPNEAMLSSALETDATLLEYAFNKKVALSGPVSLFSVLKTVAYTWQQDGMAKNAMELGELSKELLKRVSVLARHSEDLAGALDKAVGKYNEFAKSLERNVLTQANRIAEKLEAPEIDEPKKLHFESHEFCKEELLAEEDAIA